MIVAYNALSVRPGVFDGAATYTLNVLRHLPAALGGARLVVFAQAGETRIASPGVEVRPLRVAGGPAGRIVAESLLLGRELRRARADVLLSPNESLPLRLPCPVVVVAQNLVYHRDDRAGAFTGTTAAARWTSAVQAAYYRRRMSRAFDRAAATVAVSAETAAVLSARAGLDPARTTVVPEGSDSLFLPAPRAVAREDDLLLVVGALSPYKNLERALEVVARLRELRPGLRLELVGGDWRGYRQVLERRARELGVANAVAFRGQVPVGELVRLYAASTLLLHLSACESFGLPVVEAMRHSLPVVAADRSSLPEVTAGAAVLVDPDDVAATAGAVLALLDDSGARAELAGRGRARAEELTWSETARGLAAVVERVATGGGPP
jgi:glycosyltransferase involved in cell wall biosynthesis